MKVCAHCGFELEDDAKFCPNCGQKQDAVEETADTIEEPAEETYDAVQDEAEELYAAADDAEEEFEDADGFADESAALKLNVMETLTGYYRKLTGKDDAPQIWQLGVCGACALGAVLFLISACLGSVFSLIGVPACLLFGYFTLKKPKFNAVGMLIPILLFALMLTSMAASYHGFLDATADTARSLEALQEDYIASEITFDEYSKEGSNITQSFTDATENYVNRFADEDSLNDDDVIDEPAKADVVIFRILVYAMIAVYLFAQLGKLRSAKISMYSMLLIGAASAVYYFIRMFLSTGGGMVLFYLAAFLFMAAWTVFVFFSEKMDQNKKSRVLYRFFRITPASSQQQVKSIAACRIGALALAGILALISVYVIVLLFVTTIKLGDYGEASQYIFRYILITLFQLMLMLGGAFMWYRLAKKLEAGDDSFLKHYLILGFYTVGIVFMLCSTPVISGWGLFFIAVAALAVLFAGAVYCAKSKPILEYFGSDKYVTQCTLLKKMNAGK